jgi:hypothetical protein
LGKVHHLPALFHVERAYLLFVLIARPEIATSRLEASMCTLCSVDQSGTRLSVHCEAVTASACRYTLHLRCDREKALLPIVASSWGTVCRGTRQYAGADASAIMRLSSVCNRLRKRKDANVEPALCDEKSRCFYAVAWQDSRTSASTLRYPTTCPACD